LEEWKKKVEQAMMIENSDKITDLKEFLKNSIPINSNPNRFTVILGNNSLA
jgi:hypothetical protein